MELSDTVERISRKIEQKGITVDKKQIESKVRRLVDEFGVNPAEAERTVTNEMAREYSIPGVAASGGKPAVEERQIASVAPNEWVTIQGKVVSLTEAPSPTIAQTGIIADASGAIRFVIWAKSNIPPLKQGTWYRLESATVHEFRGTPNLYIHAGTTITEIESETALLPSVVQITGLKPGVGSIRAKMIQEWETSHERMLQTGLLGDESGTIKFTIWKEEGKEKLVPGTVYNIYYGQVDEYNGRLSINLNTALYIADEGDIEVGVGDAVTGVIVHVAPGSGLIKRCPVEGCNRTLSRQNYCPVHEIQQKFRYDLRLKGVLDDGLKTKNVLIQKDLVEKLTGITLEAAIELAESNPLGMDEVFYRMRDAVTGRYVSCRGTEMDGRILARQCERVPFDPAVLAGLINRAGGEPQ
ncbi:MAG: nucleotide-binding protein [Methanobacteriota archaeon]|nr:MAG: nucleotide-binding protein [Euryarchaeota archaeon]